MAEPASPRPIDSIPKSESLGGGGRTGPTFDGLRGTWFAFPAHLDPRLHRQDWGGGWGVNGVIILLLRIPSLDDPQIPLLYD